MFTQIAKELKRHAPFTAFGAATGVTSEKLNHQESC